MDDKSMEIMERFNPTHLKEEMPQTLEDMKNLLREEKTASEEKQRLEDPKTKKQYTFQIDWKDGQGHRWKGEFTNKILSIRDRQLVGIMRARLANSLPAESLDMMTQEINLIVSHLAFSLVEKPEWAEDLMALDHVELLQEIYMEVMAHEAGFFGRPNTFSEG